MIKVYKDCTIVVDNIVIQNDEDEITITKDDRDILIINNIFYIDNSGGDTEVIFTYNDVEYDIIEDDLSDEIMNILSDVLVGDETLVGCEFTIYSNELEELNSYSIYE